MYGWVRFSCTGKWVSIVILSLCNLFSHLVESSWFIVGTQEWAKCYLYFVFNWVLYWRPREGPTRKPSYHAVTHVLDHPRTHVITRVNKGVGPYFIWKVLGTHLLPFLFCSPPWFPCKLLKEEVAAFPLHPMVPGKHIWKLLCTNARGTKTPENLSLPSILAQAKGEHIGCPRIIAFTLDWPSTLTSSKPYRPLQRRIWMKPSQQSRWYRPNYATSSIVAHLKEGSDEATSAIQEMCFLPCTLKGL